MGTALPAASCASIKLAPSSSAARHPAFSRATSASSAKILARSTRSCRRAEAVSRRERRSCTRFAMVLSSIATVATGSGVDAEAFGEAFGFNGRPCIEKGFSPLEAAELAARLSSWTLPFHA